MTPEGKVKEQVRTTLAAFSRNGLWSFMPAASGYGRHGVPDFIVCFKGRFIAIECKAAGGIPTDLQLLQLSLIQGAGGHAFIVDPSNVGALAAHLQMITTL